MSNLDFEPKYDYELDPEYEHFSELKKPAKAVVLGARISGLNASIQDLFCMKAIDPAISGFLEEMGDIFEKLPEKDINRLFQLNLNLRNSGG